MSLPSNPPSVDSDLIRIAEARHHDPFNVLGRHEHGSNALLRVFRPGAHAMRLADTEIWLKHVPGTDFFEWRGPREQMPLRPRLEWLDAHDHNHVAHDPYSFPPQVGDFDMHLFREGRHWHAYRFLGAHTRTVEQIDGVLFAVWAPNAQRVSVIGDFNNWDGRIHPMRSRGGTGIWELFVPDLKAGSLYKFEIRSHGGDLLVKSDPYGQCFQMRPHTATVVCGRPDFEWQDNDWMIGRSVFDWMHRPISIYEVHLGSWIRGEGNSFVNYRELAHRLADHVTAQGFTHVELLPVNEHPLDDSWGYQVSGFFAATSRFGTPDDFRYFVDHLHRKGIGIILDWVPGHFPRDAEFLARFDGTALYEHEDPRKGEHRDWGTLIFNYGRNEVRNFLLASAVYWLEEFHLDGLRVDAVASMLYLDYSRDPGDWLPNEYGGRENLDAVNFLRELNTVVHDRFPGAMVVAEESTAWPKVSRPVWDGGLGFTMKWNMGWMHDTLEYFRHDPVHRKYHHNKLTFGQLYAYTENFVLPLSHDEVVHGKGSMLDKMPGDAWQKFANLRLLYVYQWTTPGKKLLFMGGEFGQWIEWNFRQSLDWHLLKYDTHRGIQHLIADINRLYRSEPALHALDFDPVGFEWLDCEDGDHSVLSFLRRSPQGEILVTAFNFTPVPREGFRIPLPMAGHYAEVFNSDAACYGGSNLGNPGGTTAEERPWKGRAHSAEVLLPPLGGLVFKLQRDT